MTHQHRGESRARTRMSAACRLAVAATLTIGLFQWPAGAARAQTPAPREAPSPVQAAAPNPALWVVRDADSTVYLFGTVHFLRPTTAWESPRVTAAFDSADLLVLEVADPNDQAALLPLIQRHGLAPDTPLSSLLTAEELATLDSAARTIGASAAALDGLRPWLASVTLSASSLVRAGYDPGSGADLILRARAEAAGIPIAGLETPEDQIRMLAGFPDAGQLTFLRRTLAEFDNALTVPDQLVEAWATGDVEAIQALAVTPMRLESELIYQTVLVERNLRWTDRIETLLEGSGTAFIAVGVLHLIGDDSVPAILRSRGLDVVVAP
ncbi:MAG: TraB/GumN family protein [Brevundimonas sp.]|uniref:TraB/GumN family protein n=1 Tax=Brevundimonas sp. TaxID=1871086 RepID=UPI00391DBE52